MQGDFFFFYKKNSERLYPYALALNARTCPCDEQKEKDKTLLES